MSINKVFLLGRIGKEPELRSTQSGTSVCNFSVATDDGYGDNKKTTWHNVVAWKGTAEFVANRLAKGTRVCVEGKMQYRDWTDSKGNKRNAAEVVAWRVELADAWPDGVDGGREPGPADSESVTEIDAVDDLPF